VPLNQSINRQYFQIYYYYWKMKYRSKVFPGQAMKTYRGRWGIAPLILKFGTRWRWVANFTTPGTLPPEKKPGTRGWPRSQYEGFQQRKISCPCWTSNPEQTIPQPRHCTYWTTVVSCAVPVGNISWMLFQEGRSSKLRLRRAVGQAAHTSNNPRVKCTAVYCA